MAQLACPRWLPVQLHGLLRSPWAWAVGAVLFIALRQYLGDMQALNNTLGDTDDATRLVQVRALRDGAGWYELTMGRFGGATPLVSHWSRLIDLPLAAFISILSPLFGQAGAELAVRYLWPALMLLAMLRLMVREADLRAGSTGAVLLVALVLTGLISLLQFNLGRIDHHNVMIIGGVGGLVMLARAFEDPRAGTPAGLLLGLGLAVGYEGLALVMPMIALAACAGVYETRWLEGIKRAALAMTAVLALAAFATIAPAQWLTGRCDTLSFNMVALVSAGAGGLAVISRWFLAAPVGMRFGVLFAAGFVGLAVFAAVEPTCLGGPFAQVDPAVKPIWLDRVTETFNVVRLSGLVAPVSVTAVVCVLLGIAAQIHNYRREKNWDSLFLLVAMVFAAALGLWQFKFMPYASWIASLSLAIAIAHFKGWRTLSALTVRLASIVFCCQTTIAVASEPLLMFAGMAQEDLDRSRDETTEACRSSRNLPVLNKAPPGLIAAELDFGPFIVANTHHSTLAAPYHRIDKAILALFAIHKAETAEVAERRLREAGVTYVLHCVPKPAAATKNQSADVQKRKPKPVGPPSNFLEHLKAGTPYVFLEPVDLGAEAGQVRLWRVVPRP
jgi:hypothetical protein